MNTAIPDDVDTELSRYLDAEEIRGAGIKPEQLKNKQIQYDKQRGVNNVLMRLPSGGYTKIGEEKVVDPVPPQDVGKQPPDQVFDEATSSWSRFDPTGAMPRDAAGYLAQGLFTPPSEQMPSTEIPAPEKGLFDKAISETVKGLVRGGLVRPAQFLEENFGIRGGLAVQIVDPETGEFSPALKILSGDEKAELDRRMAEGELPYAYNFEQLSEMSPEAGAGAQAVGGMAQFVGAYAGLGKLFSVGKGIIARGASRGFGADFLGFQGDEGRLTDLLLEMGVPDNMVTDFLRTDPNDPDYVGRFKNALEALPIGVLAESIGPMYRAVREGAPMETVRGTLSQLRQRAADVMAEQIQAAEGRIAREGSTLYSNPVGPVVDRALAAAGRLMGEGEQVAEGGIRAYHGSPHTFERFDMSKIGTGEGAQAYGRGLYFAESEGVARSYRDALTSGLSNWRIDGVPAGRLHASSNAEDLTKLQVAQAVRSGKTVEEAIDWVQSQYRSKAKSRFEIPENIAFFNEEIARLDAMRENPPVIEKNPGRMYEVRIDAKPEDFLDWDKPLSEQPQVLQKLLRYGGQYRDKIARLKAEREALAAQAPAPSAANDFDALFVDDGWDEGRARLAEIDDMIREAEVAASNAEKRGALFSNSLNEDFLASTSGRNLATASSDSYALMGAADDAALAQQLREAGIPGIRYLDRGSRGAGEGTRNYVVFDDALIDIVKRYGIAGLMVGAGVQAELGVKEQIEGGI